MGLLLGLSMAAFKDIGRGTGMRGAVLQFKSSLSLARQTAVTRRMSSRLCYTNDSLGQGYYYLLIKNVQTGNYLLSGTTNFLPTGIGFMPSTTGFVMFKTDGSCDKSGDSSWASNYKEVALKENGKRGMTNVVRVYQQTGRVKVIRASP